MCSVTMKGAALTAERERPPASPKGWTAQFQAWFPANQSSAGLLLDNTAEGQAKFSPSGRSALEEKLHEDTGLGVGWESGLQGSGGEPGQ